MFFFSLSVYVDILYKLSHIVCTVEEENSDFVLIPFHQRSALLPTMLRLPRVYFPTYATYSTVFRSQDTY